MTRAPFEYVVLRAVPRVDRGECINVGVMVYSQHAAFLAARWHVDPDRLLMLAPDADVAAVEAALEAIDATCAGEGPAAALAVGPRFRWLAAPRSTVVQPGGIHAGLTDDPAAELARLFDLLVAVAR
jgi:hypothetical protein